MRRGSSERRCKSCRKGAVHPLPTARARARARDELWLAGPPWCGLPRAHFASFVRRVGATRKVVDEPAFPLLKPPTGQPGAERQHWNLAAFPPPVVKDAEGNEVPPDEDAPPPELVRPSSR